MIGGRSEVQHHDEFAARVPYRVPDSLMRRRAALLLGWTRQADLPGAPSLGLGVQLLHDRAPNTPCPGRSPDGDTQRRGRRTLPPASDIRYATGPWSSLKMGRHRAPNSVQGDEPRPP